MLKQGDLANQTQRLVSLQSSISRISYKWIVTVTAILQLWRTHAAAVAVDGGHPLIVDDVYAPLAVDSLDNAFDSLPSEAAANTQTVHASSRGSAASSTTGTATVGAVLKLLWGLFLQANARGSAIPSAGRFSMWVGQRYEKYLSVAYRAGALEYFVSLSKDVLHKPRYSRERSMTRQTPQLNVESVEPFAEVSQSGSDMLVYCLISQEAVNTLIASTCFGSEISNMDAISSLVEITYRGNEDLCSVFWDRWVPVNHLAEPNAESSIPDQRYPLCKLVKLLIETCPHAPQYVCKILNALVCSVPSAVQAVVLLSQSVSLVTEVPIADLAVGVGRYADGSVEWANAAGWWQEQGRSAHATKALPVRYVGDGSSIPEERSKGVMEEVLRPPVNCIGKKLTVSKDTQSMLVRWQCNTKWLAIVMNALEQAATHSSSEITANREQKEFYCDSVSLLASLTLFLSSEAVGIFTDQWNQICLVAYLKKIDQLPVYAVLYEADVMPIDLKRNQQAVYDLLISRQVPHDAAVEVLQRGGGLYCPSFVELFMQLSVDLMSALVLHPCMPSSTHGQFSAEHESWRHLLASSLYLLRCIVSASASSEYALALMKEMTQKFDIKGPNSWSNILFRVTSLSEGTIGVYEVTEQICHLLSALLNKVQTPVPPDSNGLYNLFCKFDSDGNGTISREELQEGLRDIGYDVSISAVDALFQHIDVNISSSIHFSQLLQYAAAHATSTQGASAASSGYNAAVVFASDVDKAEQGLRLLLQDLISPGGNSSSVIAELLAGSVVDYCLNCLCSMSRWRYATPSHKWALNVNCLDMLLSVMHCAAPEAPTVLRSPAMTSACELILDRFVGDMQFQSSLMQQGLLLGLTALQTTFAGTVRESTRTLKSFIAQPTCILSADSSTNGLQPTIMPVNFSLGYYGYSASVGLIEIELVEKITLKVLDIFEQILDFARCHPEGIVLQSLNQLMSSLYTPADNIGAGAGRVGLLSASNPLLSARNVSAISGSSLPCLNIAVLCSLVDYPRSPCSPSLHPSSRIPQAAVALLAKLVAGPSGLTKTSFVDGIGAQNMRPLCRSLCAWLLSKTDPNLKYAILDFLVALCIREPLAFVLLLNVPSDSDQKSDDKAGLLQFPHTLPEKSMLVQALEKLLRRAEYLYENHPVVLHKLLELFLTLIDKSGHMSIGNVVLHLCRSKHFWDDVTVPLMCDVPPPPELASSSGAVSVAEKVTESTVSNVPNAYTHSVGKYCLQLRIHATALRILARERFGSLFFVDESDMMGPGAGDSKTENKSTEPPNMHATAEKVERIVDSFFEKANASHRFLSWVNHYTRVDIDHRLQKESEQCARTVGLNLSSLVNSPSNSRIGLPAYGASYLYHLRLARCMSATAHEIADSRASSVSSNALRVSGVSDTLREWSDLVGRVVRLNCMWSIADTQVGVNTYKYITPLSGNTCVQSIFIFNLLKLCRTAR